jgi:hypothetical protein
MMIAKLCMVGALVIAGCGSAAAQVVNPLEELEASRRGSIEPSCNTRPWCSRGINRAYTGRPVFA